MTDREFWKKPDEKSRQEMSAMRELSFQSLLKQGYEENREILIACFYDQKFPGMEKQAYIELDGGRYMICYTSKKAAKPVRGSDDWAVASIKDILNNFFNKDVAAGLLFNPYRENMMIVPKLLLEILMPGDKEKPPVLSGAEAVDICFE